ncbi:MAG: antibiotic biosynthesis monooxygenase [Bacteroidota bacterium]
MFAVIYRFKVKEEYEKDFIQAWREMTLLIYQFEGSLGSRLHRESENTFIAYAQWPDKFTFNNSGSKLPESAKLISQRMRASCENISTLHKMETHEDLLQSEVHS